MNPFSAPWKYQKTLRFSDVFRGQGKGALGTNGLIHLYVIHNWTQHQTQQHFVHKWEQRDYEFPYNIFRLEAKVWKWSYFTCTHTHVWFPLQCPKNEVFSLRISSVNVTKSEVSCGFGHIYWRNPWWKTSCFVQCYSITPVIYWPSIHCSLLYQWRFQNPVNYQSPSS